MRADSKRAARRFLSRIVYPQLMSSLLEASGHGRAHGAQTDEADPQARSATQGRSSDIAFSISRFQSASAGMTISIARTL